MTIEKIYRIITPYLFFALMSGFIIYHIAAAYSFFPLFLGGYFGIVSAAIACLYLPRFLRVLTSNIRTNPILTYLHFSIFIYALVVTLVASFYNDIFAEAVNQSYSMLVMWFSLFMLGFYLMHSNVIKTVRLSYIFYIFFLVFILFYVVNTGSVMLDLKMVSEGDVEEVSGYQSLARNLLVTVVLLICYSKKAINTSFLVITAVFCLFYLGARSEFVAFIFFAILFVVIKTRYHKKYFFVILATLLGALTLFVVFQDELLASRQLQLLDLSDSSSWNAREGLKEAGIKQILDNPVFGLFGGHVLSGGVGRYIHNSLSGYVNYGAYFYFNYMFISIYITLNSFYRVLKHPNQQKWWYSFSINSCCLILILFSKPVFWPIPFFAWGVYFGVKSFYYAQTPTTHIDAVGA